MSKFAKYLIVAIVALATGLSAQAQFRRAVTAGAALSSLHFKEDLISVSRLAGPTVGVMGEVTFSEIGLGMDLGLQYSMLGAKLGLGEREIWASEGFGPTNLRLHTITLPVNLRFKWTRMDGFEDYAAPFVFGGPLVDFTVGHSKCSAMEYAFGAIGLQCGGGVELFKRVQLQASYVWGMTYNLKAVKLTDFSARNRYWSFRVNYFF